MQESLTNVIRHAGASRVDVAIAQRPGKGGPASGDGGAWLELTVRDDGCGIAPGAPMGFGMRGMQERVQGLGGSYGCREQRRPGRRGRDRDPAAGRRRERVAVHA